MAADVEPTVFGPKATEQIAKTVREVSRRMMNEQPHRGRWQQRQTTAVLLEAIVSSCIGNGWYSVEVAEFTGEPDVSQQSSGEDACDLCTASGIDTTPGGECEAVTSIAVTRSAPVGTGEFVSAHDTEYLPLEIGGHCRIMPIHMSSTGEQLYAVIRGPHPLVRDPRGDWDCCDGTVVQTGCDYLVHEGVSCTGWRQECPS